MTSPAMLGDAGLWQMPKAAFLCSDKFSAGSVLKSYDWATEMKRKGRCVISGFQSKIEKDVLDILLGGSQPIILALARGLYVKPPAILKPHVESGRLLIVSIFDAAIGRSNRELAFKRNQFCADAADEVVFAHIHKGGMLEKLNVIGKPAKILDADECIISKQKK
jgi:hypothetical protein